MATAIDSKAFLIQEQGDSYPLSLTTQEFAPFSIDVVG